MNITEPFFRHAATWPDRAAFVFKGRSMSYGMVAASIELARSRLQRAGVRRGDRVAVAVRTPHVYLSIVLALARMGAVATAFKHGAPADVKEKLLLRHATKALIQEPGDDWRSSGIPAHLHLTAEALFARPAPGEVMDASLPAAEVAHEPWLISFSSGTTGLPKSIPQTHARTMLNVMLGQGAPRAHVAVPRLLVFADASASVATNHALRAWMSAGTVICIADASPKAFFELVEEEHPNQMLTTTALVGMLVAAARKVPDSLRRCASLESIMVSGSVVSPALREGILTRLCKNLEINYGAAEAGVLALADANTLASRPDSAGRLMPWVQAQALDEDGRPLPAGERGILRFSSPTLVGSYVGDEAASAKSFRDGWFYPGDVGSVDAAGFLSLSGRTDDRLNLGGRKIDPGIVEQALNDHPAVAESAVVAMSHGEFAQPVLVAVVVRRADVEPAVLKQWCRERLGPAMEPQAVVFIDALPRNENGKVRRDAVLEKLRFVPSKSTRVPT